MSGGALAHDSASPMHARRVSAGCGLRPGGGGGGGRGLVVGGRGSWGSVREGTGRGYAPCVRDRGPRLHFTSLRTAGSTSTLEAPREPLTLEYRL